MSPNLQTTQRSCDTSRKTMRQEDRNELQHLVLHSCKEDQKDGGVLQEEKKSLAHLAHWKERQSPATSTSGVHLSEDFTWTQNIHRKDVVSL